MTGTLLATLGALAPPDEIRRKAKEIVSRPEYELETPQKSEALGIFTRILKWILERLQAFFDAMAGLPDVLRWIIVAVLLVALCVLVWHILYTFVSAFRGRPQRSSAFKDRERKMAPDEWETLAERAYQSGDYIGAVRCLFSAALLRIERAEDRPIRKGITNRELLRRYRSTSLFAPLTQFVETIDAKWYGHDLCEEADYLSCREEHSRIRRIAERRMHAVGA